MAKKKTTKTAVKSTSFAEAVGMGNPFSNERILFVIGAHPFRHWFLPAFLCRLYGVGFRIVPFYRIC